MKKLNRFKDQSMMGKVFSISIPLLMTTYFIFNMNSLYTNYSNIEVLSERLHFLNILNSEISSIEGKKDIEKKIMSGHFSLMDKEILQKAGINKINHLKFVKELHETRPRKDKNKDSREAQESQEYLDKQMKLIISSMSSVGGHLIKNKHWARDEFDSIHKRVLSTSSGKQKNLLRWQESQRKLISLKEKIEQTRIKNNFKENLVGQLVKSIETMSALVSFLGSERSYSNAMSMILIKFNDLRSFIPEKIDKAMAKRDSYYRVFYLSIIQHFIQIGLLLIFAMAYYYRKVRSSFAKELKEVKARAKDYNLAAEHSVRCLKILEKETFIASVLLNENETILWSNQKFKDLFDLKLKKGEQSWKIICRDDVFDHSKGTGVFGAVKLRSNLNKDYILKSKTLISENEERRIVQIWELEKYYLELAGKNSILTVPKDFIPESYSEIGNLLDELLVKMSVFFDNFKINVDLDNKLPTLTKVNSEHLVLSLANILKGVIFYLNHSDQGSSINISYNKANSKIIFKFEVMNTRIELSQIDQDLRFNNRSYHSLGYYLSEGEEFLEDYGAKVGVRNFLATSDETSIAVIEIELDEEIKIRTPKKYKNIQFQKINKKMEIEGLI